MNKQDLIEAVKINDRIDNIKKLALLVSFPKRLTIGTIRCNKEGTLLPELEYGPNEVKSMFEPELQEVIRSWSFKKIDELEYELEKLLNKK